MGGATGANMVGTKRFTPAAFAAVARAIWSIVTIIGRIAITVS